MKSTDQVLNFLNTHIQHTCERAVTFPLITYKYLLHIIPVIPKACRALVKSMSVHILLKTS